MGTISEIKEIPEKYKKYRDKIIELFKQNDINSISSLVAMYKANPEFKENWHWGCHNGLRNRCSTGASSRVRRFLNRYKV